MKKFLCLVFALTILTGCTTASAVTIENKKVTVNSLAETTAKQLLSDLDGDFSIGEGFVPVVCDDLDNLMDSDDAVYPVYKNDELAYLLVCSEERRLIEVDKEIDTRIAKEHCFVKVNGNVYLATKDGNILLSGNDETEEVKALLKKIDLFKMTNTRPTADGAKVIEKGISTISEDGKIIINGVEYSNNRITVTFVEGDTDTCVKVYEKFCNGKLVSKLESINTFTFEFEQLSTEEMISLLEKTQKLEYVTKVSLDGVVSTQPVGNNNSLQ